MSSAFLKCQQCHREYIKQDETSAFACSHYILCRNCMPNTRSDSCNICLTANSAVSAQHGINSINNDLFKVKTERRSKISKQTHIVEELSADGIVQYHCTACGKIFGSRSQKYYHLQCNQTKDASLHECDVCKKTFARLSQLKYHKESHVSPINECSKCQKTFSNPLALRKHQSLHKVKPKQCPHCDKTFLKKVSLEEHIAGKHFQQLQYGCAYCNKKYASKSTLQLHLQTHEEKRFECSFCGKHFQRNSILNLHLKRHSLLETYRCEICDKSFKESGALTRHRMIHEENALQYHCNLCDKTILRKDNMTRHVNTIHSNELFSDIVSIIKPLSTVNENGYIKENNDVDRTDPIPSINKTEKSPESTNKILIIENRVLQKPEENLVLQETWEESKICATNKQKHNRDTNPARLSAIETQAQVIENLCNDQTHNSIYVEPGKLLKLETKCLSGYTSNQFKHSNSNDADMNERTNDHKSLSNTISYNESYDLASDYNKTSVIRTIGNVKKTMNFKPIPYEGTRTTNVTSDCEYKHKKYNRHYNVDLYRKILGCDEEDSEEDVDALQCNHQVEQQQNSCDAANATPVHWRKNFKKSYETSVL